jgi:hypothetical protein
LIGETVEELAKSDTGAGHSSMIVEIETANGE